MRMPTFVVTGSATRYQPAERGTLRVKIAFDGDDRSAVLESASRTHARLVEQVKGHIASGAATWWGTQAVTAWPFDEWVKPKANVDAVKVRRVRAGCDLQVKFADFGALAQWASQIGALDGVSVIGIDWALTEKRRDGLVREVRTSAARESAERARAFAAALGYSDVRLVTLYEEGLRPNVDGARPVALATRGHAHDAGGASAVELRPDDIEISCTVTADYETT